MNNTINRIEKIIENNGFEVRRFQKEEIKKMLTVYLERNISGDVLPDCDGGTITTERFDSYII